MRLPATPNRALRIIGMLLLATMTFRADSGAQPPAKEPTPARSFPLPEKVRLEIREKQLALQQLAAQMLEAQLILERGAAQITTLREALQESLESAARDHKCQQVTETLLCVHAEASKPESVPPSKQ